MTRHPDGDKFSDSAWTAAVEAQAESRRNVVYEVELEVEDEVRTVRITAWMYNTNFGEHSLVTFWDQERPVASFSARHVRQIRIVSDTEAT
ncbi:MAG: hypothetical protein M3323_08485 [Actinomycetota bacterium]|nr:hypothetical protein [Actinomycetota bacterium]